MHPGGPATTHSYSTNQLWTSRNSFTWHQSCTHALKDADYPQYKPWNHINIVVSLS